MASALPTNSAKESTNLLEEVYESLSQDLDFYQTVEKLCETPNFIAYRLLKMHLKKNYGYSSACDGWDMNELETISSFKSKIASTSKKRKHEELTNYLSQLSCLFSKCETKINKNI